MNYRLRKASAADLPAIDHLFTEMLRSIYKTEPTQGYTSGQLDDYFAGGENWICVAETEASIVGYLSIEVHRDDMSFLYYDDCCVDGACRNLGIGSALLDAAEAYGISLGINAALLHVEKGNEAAQRLYRRKGFSLLREEGSRLCMKKEPLGNTARPTAESHLPGDPFVRQRL